MRKTHKKIVLVESPSEIGAGKRGGSLGIEAIKVAARKIDDPFFAHIEKRRIIDFNDILDSKAAEPYAKRIGSLIKVFRDLQENVNEILTENNFPVIITGDHSTGAAIIAGIKKAYPEGRLGVIWIDAHADLHSPYTTPSGNVHGMPLAMALSEDNMAFRKNDPDRETIKTWEELKKLGLPGQDIQAQDIVFIAIRDTEKEEEALIREKNIRAFRMPEIMEKGIREVAEETLIHLKDCDQIFISFDVDSMDSERVSSGTGTAVKDGLLAMEAEFLIQELLSDDRVCAFEITEINPALDNEGNRMAEVSFQILKESFMTIQL